MRFSAETSGHIASRAGRLLAPDISAWGGSHRHSPLKPNVGAAIIGPSGTERIPQSQTGSMGSLVGFVTAARLSRQMNAAESGRDQAPWSVTARRTHPAESPTSGRAAAYGRCRQRDLERADVAAFHGLDPSPTPQCLGSFPLAVQCPKKRSWQKANHLPTWE